MSDVTDFDAEAEDAGDHEVPAVMVELHEVLEWEAAVAAAEGDRT